jgi:hypothetical protein
MDNTCSHDAPSLSTYIIGFADLTIKHEHKDGYTKDVSKVDPSWAPLSPPLLLLFRPSVVLSLKHPNKGPKWGQTHDGILKLGIITFFGGHLRAAHLWAML